MSYQANYQKAKQAGYSDQEIMEYLGTKDPAFEDKMMKAQEAGYSPQEVLGYFNSSSKQEEPEGALKSTFRTAAQVPLGVAEGTPYGIGASLFQLGALGESDLSVEEWHNLRKEYEKSGKTFDEEAYERGRQEMLGMIPTVSNIASKVEKETGIPLDAKTHLQKGIRFASAAGKISPKGYTIRGMNTALPRPVLGAAVEGVREVLLKMGVPEQVADIASFAILKKPTEGAGKIDVGVKEKPSGMPERGFESLKEKREVPAAKLNTINEKLSNDFQKVSDKIIQESPIGETANNIKNDPTFKQASRELLDQAQVIANETSGTLPTMHYKQALLKQAQTQIKGFALNEYKKNYMKYIKEAIDDVLPENMTYGELVEQYRENNRALGEYFEPGSSKAVNRAKKDALLDQNRAIASVIEKSHPELSQIFKEGNSRWTKIMDAEAVDSFVKEMFSEGKPNYKKMHDFFDKNGYDRLFKKALGEDGYKAFEQAMKDMLETEVPYNMMKATKERGIQDFLSKLIGFKISPKVGLAQVGWDVAQTAYRGLINSLLDKPKLAFVFEKAVKQAKNGNFKAAEEGFKTVQAEVMDNAKPNTPSNQKTPRSETVDITPKIKQIESSSKQPQQIDFAGPSAPLGLPEGKQPKLIEYKPKPLSEQTPKERAEGLARQNFKDVVEGKPISAPAKQELKKVRASLLTTRGQGQQFHGTKSPIKELSEDIYSSSSPNNIYGPGFYTTDALDIADGYANSFAGTPAWMRKMFSDKEHKPIVYQIKEKTPQKIYDAEQSIKEFQEWWLERMMSQYQFAKKKTPNGKNLENFEIYKEEMLDYLPNEILFTSEPRSVREFYDEIRDWGYSEEITVHDMNEYFDEIQSLLERKGFQGISHKGGLLTDNHEHVVKIYWEPQNLEIQEFSYPKFKKVPNPNKLK